MPKMLLLPCAVAMLLAFPVAARADDSGFASSHTLRKERGFNCMADHFHTGSGEGKSKIGARAAAIKSWAEFVVVEYGSDWARYGRAGSAAVHYTKSADGWSANIDARPCR